VQDVRACFNTDTPDCKHNLPAGQCVCTWEHKPEYQSTHIPALIQRKYYGICTVCDQLYEPGVSIVKSSYTWGRWIHLECVPYCHHVWTTPEDNLQDALGEKPWLEDLSTRIEVNGELHIFPETEDKYLLDPRDELEDTNDELQALLESEGISGNLITEWRELLPDVVERTVLYEVVATPETQETSPWQDEVGEYLLGSEELGFEVYK